MLKIQVIAVAVLGISLTPVLANVVGDACYVGNAIGTCQVITDCPVVHREREKHKKKPQICGFRDVMPIICCPNDQPPPTANRADGFDTYCEQYANFAYERIQIPGTNETIREAKCTIHESPFEGRQNVAASEFPHMALVGSDTPGGVKFFCSGILISDKFLVTAAHCVHNTEAKYVKMIGNKPEYFAVKRVVPYPSYTNTSFYHDIGLIELNRPVNFSPYIRPACLPPMNYNVQNVEEFTASTWEAGQEVGGQFLKIRLERVSKGDCDTAYAGLATLPEGIDHEKQICTKIHGTESNDCQLNVGGPIQVPHTGAFCSYMVLGITSFAKACGFTQPVVYTNFLPYINWIVSIVFSKET